jgi:hypothetical protein
VDGKALPGNYSFRIAGRRLGISLVFMLSQQGTSSEIERVFAEMAQQRPDAVLVSGEGDLYAYRKLIAELAEKNGLPTMGAYREHVEAGGLMAYGVDLAELLGRMADGVREIFKGAKPGDIPILSVHQIRVPDQPEVGKSARLHLAAGAACSSRRHYRMKMVFDCGWRTGSPSSTMWYIGVLQPTGLPYEATGFHRGALLGSGRMA